MPPTAIRTLPATLPDVVDDAVEGALAAAKRPHSVVRVAVAVQRDLDVVQPERQQAIDDLFGEQQAVGDDADDQRERPRCLRRRVRPLGEVVQHRKIDERLTAEEGDAELLRIQLLHPIVDPGGNLRARIERHLVGVLVVVAVVALEAVIAREIALQRRQNRDAQLLGVLPRVGEKLVQRLPVGLPARRR